MHMLDPWQLKAFLTAASAGSLRRAAEELSLSPSAVTARIKALEEAVGVPLFSRTGNRATLTEHGRRLVGYARRLLDLEAEARQRLTGGGEDGPQLTVRLSESLGLAVLPAVLAAFRARHPGVRLILAQRSAAGLARDLRHGVVDCGVILGQPYAAEGIAATVIHREPLVAIAPPGDALAGRNAVGPADLYGRELFVTPQVWGFRERLEQGLDRAGAVPASVTECGSLALLARCVAAGLGMGLAPRLAAAALSPGGELALIPWAEPGFTAAVTVMRLAGRAPGPAEAAFLNCLGEAIATASQKDPLRP
ncbi:LysR family transcriptional regulator [Solidesulfovibrio magneticus]|uniref:LysR family transcriptional regulator n=1 Tax=Solidesulfovibrio magneticus (strain ATCC 700980 / DSM 13731 / RS-1) TaxID=573370 RepID=C4XND1_SOLM1|nr:LysR family transcriptional regulator [Solidesulfovibrio magneticus]BAH77434.1 LysR family transcriptional regulator [Solidesulfovibrio magneticus RS-1]